MPYNVYMCIKFPFLYPRNRFTGKHYNNWKIIEKIKKINAKPEYKVIDFANFTPIRQRYNTLDRIKVWVYVTIENILAIFHCLPTYTELDAMPKGWREAFGIQMCKELKAALKDGKCLKNFRITQIKEKFGTLRFYVNYGTDDVYSIIHKYEHISWYTCVECGKPAYYINDGWVLPYCEKHAENGTKERRDFYGWTKSKYKIKGSDETFSYENDE